MDDFCKIYAMDIGRRASLLKMLELKTSDHLISKILQEYVLKKNATKIVENFYAYLLQYDEFSSILDPQLIPNLKVTQADYVRSFGVDFDTSQYFNHRLRVGLVHKKVGLTLGLYQCAYRELQQLMLNEIPENFSKEGVCCRDLHRFIHKITTLDMTLAIETYHGALVMDIQNKLDNAYVEKARLREQVRTDSLTGLYTRDYGYVVLKECLSSSKAKNETCLILADIDHFKIVNDTYGHLAGDEVLRQIASLLNSAVRDLDAVCRYGGEEFLIVLCRSQLDIAIRVAERIRQSVSDNIVQYNGESIRLTISQGIAVVESESDIMSLLNKADMALYQAKQQGRDCIVVSGADVTRN